MGLQETDAECAAVAVAPRVSLENIQDAIARVHYTDGEVIAGEIDPDLRVLTICLVKMINGFTIIGKSAPASAANFNANLGKKLALDDAMRQIWPLMGFELRERLHLAGKA